MIDNESTPKVLMGLMLGILLSAGAVGLFGLRWLDAQRQTVFADAQERMVVVARTDLSAGTELSMENIGLKAFYANHLPVSRVLSPSDAQALVTKRLRYRIMKGEPILSTDIEEPAEPAAPPDD